MVDAKLPSKEEVESYIRERNNWGRWGDDDQRGVTNLITPEKVVAATRLVQNGRQVSLSRFLPKTPAPGNPVPAQHWMYTLSRGDGQGSAGDFYGLRYHGQSTTHLDSIAHYWNENRMWGGRDPAKEITFDGANWGSVEHFGDGIVTRGVLLDVPKYRGQAYVADGTAVHGWELEEVAKSQGVTVQPGDALVVYSGREAYNEANPQAIWGSKPDKPGLHVSCLPFIRDNDVSLIVWDMMDLSPMGHQWSVHSAIPTYGVLLLDNSLLQPLAEACAEEGRYEFMLVVAPLKMKGGTGSPVNPIAIF